jgi:hypothetical protein
MGYIPECAAVAQSHREVRNNVMRCPVLCCYVLFFVLFSCVSSGELDSSFFCFNVDLAADVCFVV